MRKISLLLVAILYCSLAPAQQKKDPVHWDYTLKKTADRNFEVRLLAAMDEGWHIYAQTQPPEAISVPTRIVFAKNPLVRMDGKPKEIGEKETYQDKAAGIVQYQYGGKVEFVQGLSLKTAAKTSLQVAVTYQACTGEMCLPPKTVNLTIPLQ